ncbi:MAG: MBL fold metallo-hydrolase [Phycisphaerae bacterium]|nr:MBL fold metallo-hydrolase [Phycisphaerae bacterium]
MNNLRKDLPGKGKISIYWLGGAGFVFKFDSGLTICVDPYLSDTAERLVGFKRLCESPIKAEELHFDVLFFTHDHCDHLDVDSFDILMQSNPKARVLAPAPCVPFLQEKNAVYELVAPGTSLLVGDNIRINTVAADHGTLCPGAVGFVLKFSGRSLYFSGDTACNEVLLKEVIASRPEIIVPCINGAYGNMNEAEAAALAGKCGAKIAVPSHYDLFAEHGGNVDAFVESLKVKSPGTRAQVLTPGLGVEV